MKQTEFIHLHLHTQFSLLDGTIRLDDLFKKAKEFNMSAVAMTDHGNIFGAISFYQQAHEYGIKPIIGCELYVAVNNRLDKSTNDTRETSYHLIVLAKNMQGYKNLMKLTTLGYLEGFYYRPRIDKEILSLYHEGLIGLSACLNGEISYHLQKDHKQEAYKVAQEYREIFCKNNFYLEIMDNGLPEQKRTNEGLLEISRRLSIPLVATNDCHYLNREDAEAHEVLLCIQTGKNIEDPHRMRFGTDQFYFRSSDEMKKLFQNYPESIENTLTIAEKCNLTFEFGKFFLPEFKLNSSETLDDNLKKVSENGIEKLMPIILENNSNENLRERYEKRLKGELEIIKSMGFAGYFLIVSDFVNYAKKQNIPVGPGRGSVAGSLVAYAIGITNIDPIRYGLLFERFLNPDRISMPDIDIDFCQEGRNDIIKYVTEKYGSDKVSQIITFGKMQAKAVIRDVGRAMNISYGEVDRIAKMIPNVLNITLDKAIEMEPHLQEEANYNEKIKKLLDLSRSLEGLNRHASTHAAGVVISDVPLVERVPLCKSPKGDIVTQFSMNDIQTVGLTKFDFLGLKTLTVIKNALGFIREVKGESKDIRNLPPNDEKTYKLLMRGDTDGIFQLESSGMKDILVNLKPDCIEDLIALIALYRPGPMNMVSEFISRKQGRKKIVYETPELKDILKETYGVILYQEQVMQIASMIGNYTMAEADSLRKVMSKKKVSEMEQEKPKFLEGAKIKGIQQNKAKKIWEQMETFAEYGFNKSHSAAYAMISYQTAYLKAHYPVEFMAALLTSEKDNRDKIIKYINSCKDMGIKVFPPDINESLSDFSVVGEHIRFGLAAVKNVGIGAIESIIAAREKEGGYKSLSDFCSRVDLKKINKRTIESLIKCGAFDSTGYYRQQLMACYEEILDISQKRHKDKYNRQVNLFDHIESQNKINQEHKNELSDIPEWNHQDLLAYEKETLGFYISGHPLSRFDKRLGPYTNTDSSNINEKNDKDIVSFAGIVSGIREITTKRKDIMAYVTVEDMKGSISVICFAEVYKNSFHLLHSEEPLFINGTIDIGEDSLKVIATDITSLSQVIDQPFNSVHFIIDTRRSLIENIESLKNLLKRHVGKMDGFIHLLDENTETIIYLGEDIKLDISNQLKREAAIILGENRTKFL